MKLSLASATIGLVILSSPITALRNLQRGNVFEEQKEETKPTEEKKEQPTDADEKPDDVYTRRPTPFPTPPPTTCEIPCETNYDCPRICQAPSPYAPKTCSVMPNPPPTPGPTSGSTPPPTTCECTNPSNIPDKCEVDILLEEMDFLVTGNPERLAQLTRAAFHDAGTFDQTVPEGGANGCLLTDMNMRLQPENGNLDDALNSLQGVMDDWHAHGATCIDVSSADMLQFAIFFAVVRQQEPNIGVLTNTKRDFIKDNFHWGRIDETNCDVDWTLNLPGFVTPVNSVNGPLAARCAAAGVVIDDTMVALNGFTPEEATVLIGAHTIGKIRNTFGSLGTEWVPGGDDLATPLGPKFDNEYFEFLINDVAAPHNDDAFVFESNGIAPVPWDTVFPTWFKINNPAHSHFDTDLTLAFPNVGPHSNFRPSSEAFANSNEHFIETFMLALDKMGKLGQVNVQLVPATECEELCPGVKPGVFTLEDALSLLKKLGNATAFSDNITRDLQVERNDKIQELIKPQDSRELCCTSKDDLEKLQKERSGDSKA